MRQNINLSKDIEGELYDKFASTMTHLKYSGGLESDILLKGDSDLAALHNIKNVFLLLRQQFSSAEGPKIVLGNEKKDDFNKRLILLENEIDGIMRRRIQYSVKDQQGGMRTLDYGSILNEKENQIVELERKITNLEERLRRANARQIDLQNRIVNLQQQLLAKENIINAKNQVILAEVASSNAMKETINRLKKNLDLNRHRIGDMEKIIMEGIVIPDVGGFEIKADSLAKDGAMSRSRTYTQSSESQKVKTRVVQMMREMERVCNQPADLTIQQVEKVIENFINTDFRNSRLFEGVQISIRRERIEQDYERLRNNFAAAAGIYQQHLNELRTKHPQIRIGLESNLFEILQRQRVQAYQIQGGAVFIDNFSQRTVEVPVQDARTKQLLHMLAVQLKKIVEKYPKLSGEIDNRLMEYFQQQLIDVIEVDEIDRLVEVVKFVPQIVKVENVYASSNEKSRKMEFHLRVLIKALLEELEKLKNKTGVALEIDEGIVGMIRQEIMGVVSVDDILKVFRSVPKIVQVEKIVEKIVERVVEIPKVEVVEKIVEKVVDNPVIKEIEKVRNVELQVPKVYTNTVQKIVPIENIIEKVVEVPVIVEKIVEVIKEVPKVEIVEKEVQRIVEVQKIVEVERVVNHFEKEFQPVELVKEVVVEVERVVEKIVQVPRYEEKIIEKIVQVPKIIQVEKVVEKIVPQIQYRNARQIINHIEVQHNVVDRVVEKVIPITKIVEKIVEVPQVMEKIVTVTNTQTQIREVEVWKEKLVFEEKIRQIEKPIPQVIELVKEVPKEIEKFIEIPLVQEKVKYIERFIEKPVIETIKSVEVKEVYLRDPLIIRQPKIVEVEKIVNQYIEVPKIEYIKEDKIVEVPVFKERIKEVPIHVDKVIEKMVEVPKVVETEKIVEKIVVVPRVIEKVVEVPQIVEKVVQKELIKTEIKEVEKRVEVPVFQDRVVEFEVEKNVFIEVERVIDRIVDKLVEVPKEIKEVEIQKIVEQKIIEVFKEIPRTLEVEKLVPLYEETAQVIEVQRPIIVPVEVPVPVERIVEKLVPVTQVQERVVQVPQIIEKIITVKEQDIVVKQIEKLVEKIVVDTQIKEIERVVPYIQEAIKEIPTVVEKIVPVCTTVQEIVTAQQIVQKIVQKAITIPKIKEVERVKEIMVEIPKFIEIQKIVPQIQRVNQYIQRVVEKIVEVPVIIEHVKEIEKEIEKVVQVHNESKEVVEVEKNVETIAIMEKIKEVVREVNHIEKVIQIVDRLEQVPVEVIVKEEKFVEIPLLMEKIVEKITVMPQIVEVLKYVHEVCETEDLGVAVQGEDAVVEQKYRALSKNIKGELDVLLREIRVLRSENPRFGSKVEIIEKFLAQFQKFILFPRIMKVPVEKIVEKEVEKIVRVPGSDERSVRFQLTLSLLVEKLLLELKRVKERSGINLELDDDIKLIFFSELKTHSKLEGEFSKQLDAYCNQMQRQFEQLGHWSYENQFMLNSFLQERFVMAELVHNANMEIEKARETSQKRLQGLRRYKNDKIAFEGFLQNIGRILLTENQQSTERLSLIQNIIRDFERYINGEIREPMMLMGNIEINDQRISSLLRQKDQQIIRLRTLATGRVESEGRVSSQITINMKRQNEELRKVLRTLEGRLGPEEVDNILLPFQQQINQLQNRNLELQNQVSEVNSSNINLHTEIKVLQESIREGSRLVYLGGQEPIITSFASLNEGRQGQMTERSQYKERQQSSIIRQGADYSRNIQEGSRTREYGVRQTTQHQTSEIKGQTTLQGTLQRQGVISSESRIQTTTTHVQGQGLQGQGLQGQAIQGQGLQGQAIQGQGLQGQGLQGQGLQGQGIQGQRLQGQGIQGQGIQGQGLGYGLQGQGIQGQGIQGQGLQGQGIQSQGVQSHVIQGQVKSLSQSGVQGQTRVLGQSGIQGGIQGQGALGQGQTLYQSYHSSQVHKGVIQGGNLQQSGMSQSSSQGGLMHQGTSVQGGVISQGERQTYQQGQTIQQGQTYTSNQGLFGIGNLAESREAQMQSPIQGARLVQSGIREAQIREGHSTVRSTIIKEGELPSTASRQGTQVKIIRSPHIITPQRKKEEEQDKNK